MAASNCRSESAERLLSFEELRAQLRAVGEERYHHQHPFHLLMHEGRLSREQLQAWALNRYYYQSIIPIKDSIILSRGTDPGFAAPGASASSITTATAPSEGGIKRWLKLAEATGLSADRFAPELESFPRRASR